jgi:carbonic anhydrase/acetyltransferase-like protein (isoleucine patch superfamily)
MYLATALVSEFGLVAIGDYAALNHGVVVQNHLFEDRVFKSSQLTIGPEVSIGNMTVVLYDTVIERGAVIGPLSLLMKGETLVEGTRWRGIPTEAVAVAEVVIDLRDDEAAMPTAPGATGQSWHDDVRVGPAGP